MAAKKQVTSVSKAGKSEPNEAIVEAAPKRKARKRTRRPAKKTPVETLPLHENIDPQVLADLAIKIIHLRSGTATERKPVRFDNSGLHDSLDDARRLLLAAKGVIDEDVDAYRLFSEDDEPMSYEKISKRLKLRGWKYQNSRNKVEDIILELVKRAEEEVQKEREKYEALVSVRLNYAGGVYSLVDRMRERIRAMVGDFELEVLFSDPDQVADAMGQFFLHLMGKDIADDWERHLDEELASVAGLNSFIKYVCGGRTYEQFIPTVPSVRMDPERLACLEFFLESADAWATSDYKAKAKDLNILMRFIRGRDNAPASMVAHLKNFLKELRKTPVKAESVKQMAKAAHEELKIFCERLHLAQVVKVQKWHPVTDMLGILSEAPNSSEQDPVEKIKDLYNLLRETEKSVKNMDFKPAELRARLNELGEKLAETSNLLKAEQTQVFAEEMDKVAEGLMRGLQVERIGPMDLELALDNLISELTPHAGARKCRPYELFLFAAQKGLCREELIRKRSSLVRGVHTQPPYPSSLSILTCHRGADIAMGIEESA